MNGRLVSDVGLEDDHRLGPHGAVLGPPERQDVDPGVSAERAELDVEVGGGVGQPRTVEVEAQTASVGPLREGRDLVDRVARAELGGLGDRHHLRLYVVLVADAGHRGLGQVGGELPVGRVDAEQLAPDGALGRAALVVVDVRARGADHRLEGPEQRQQPDHVGAGAVEGEIGLGRPRRSGRGRAGPRVSVNGSTP